MKSNSLNITIWMRRSVTLIILALAVLFGLDLLYDPQHFHIKEINISGEFKLADRESAKAAAVSAINANYFAQSLGDVEKELKELPWVYKASVRRQWPDALAVHIVEVNPIARWGDKYWVHADGQLVGKESWSGATGLPYIVAPRARHREVWEVYQNWVELFAEHELSITKLELEPSEIWRISLQRGDQSVVLNVPYAEANISVVQLLRLFSHSLKIDFAAIESLDLRYPNGFAVGWRADKTNK